MDAVPGIRTLSVAGCECRVRRLGSWRKLRGFSQLESLDLSSNGLDPRDFEMLAEAPWFGRLKRLDLTHSAAMNVGLQSVLRRCRNLEQMRLVASGVGREGMQTLADTECRGLQDLEINVTASSLPGVTAILESHHGRTLRHLTLVQDGDSPSFDSISRFARSLRESTVEIFELDHAPECERWIEQTFPKDGPGRIRSLRAQVPGIGACADDLVDHLVQSTAASSLLELEVIGDLTIGSLYRIANSEHLRQVRRLRLGSPVRSGGNPPQPAATDLCQLQHLDIAAFIEPSAYAAMARLLESLPQLRSLTIREQFQRPFFTQLPDELKARLRFRPHPFDGASRFG
jgi:hypothetical protein